MKDAPPVLWSPSRERIERATITQFARKRGLPEDYHELWRWSVEHLEEFWGTVWAEFGVAGSYDAVLTSRAMPGAEWFPGAKVNYAEHLFRGKPFERCAILHASESRGIDEWTWGDLRDATARIAAGLKRLGVGQGDRVAALLPNIPETVAAFLATASLGAVWSCTAPESGAQSVIDRFAQIDPKVLLSIDGYRYAGKRFDCTDKVAQISARLPTARVIRFGYLDESGWENDFLQGGAEALTFARVPFDHPLWILYSSGTTGLPKALVHSQGGVLLEQLKTAHLHLDCHEGDRFFWFTTTGWMMWNFVVGVLLTDAAIVLFDGNPSGDVLWDLASSTRVTTFGTSAAFITAAMQRGVNPAAGGRDLTALRAVGSTGSPLPPECFTWAYKELGADLWLFSMSGGTDVVTPFVGGVPTLPVYLGEIQAPALGVKVAAWDDHRRPLIGQVGELVVTAPMPSMPIYMWNDPDGHRLRESYFEMYPDVWRHGDWIEITPRGTVIIYGRSDSTINRAGIRMGTSEIYRSLLRDALVVDALVVDVPVTGEENWMPLFVVLAEGTLLDSRLSDRIRSRVRGDCSPRHVPSDVYQVPEIPRTLSGKIIEIPVKRILMGELPDRAVSRDSLANPAALDWFVEFTARRPLNR